MVRIILRLEGLAFFLTSLYFYNLLKGNWLIFVLLLFTPDISMIGYLRNNKIGSVIYNVVHNYILALIIICVSLYLHYDFVILLGIILFAHVAWDRFFGYGLKYPTAFKDTHLQKI